MLHYARNPAGLRARAARISRINHLSTAASCRPTRSAGPTMRIALYEPDIPQNTGTILRLCACLGIEAHIIEPSGFPVTDRAFRRAGMDYIENVSISRHSSFVTFDEWRQRERLQLVLLTTAAERSYLDHAFTADQVLLFGRESAGVPASIHERADVRLRIPMQSGMRSLNIAMAAAMVAGEALRQTRDFAG